MHRISSALGLHEIMLREIMSLKLNVHNINEFGRFDELKKTVDKKKAKQYFEEAEGRKIIPPKVNIKVDNLLRKFILSDGVDIKLPKDAEANPIDYAGHNDQSLPMIAEDTEVYSEK